MQPFIHLNQPKRYKLVNSRTKEVQTYCRLKETAKALKRELQRDLGDDFEIIDTKWENVGVV